MATQRLMVVGVDGSDRALEAVDWAAAEAAERGFALRVCHVRGDVPNPADQDRNILSAAADRAHEVAADLPVEQVTVSGNPTEALISAAAGTEALVLGARGGGGFTALLLGSVSEQAASHGRCPVVVVRGARRRGPIAVGVDGSPESRAALGFAFERAADLGVAVRAVHAYTLSAAVTSFGAVPGGVMPDIGVEEVRSAGRQTLEAALLPWTDKYPDVSVTRRLVDDLAATALVGESTDCSLLAVGSRGRGGFVGLMLGSVSRHALRHAECPVAVVRS